MMDRSTYIGGADIAALLKKTPYGDIWTTWAKKTGRVLDDPDNHHMARGNTMEAIIAAHVRTHVDQTISTGPIRRKYGTHESYMKWVEWMEGEKDTPEPQISVIHPKFPYCGGHPDDIGKDIVWEYKAPAMRNFEMLMKSGLHEYWLLQNQYYLWILKALGHPAKEGRIVVWDYDNWRPLITRVRPDTRLWSQFEKVCPAFWWHVEMDTPPAMTGHTETLTLIDDKTFDDILAQHEVARNLKNAATNDEKYLKAIIRTYMGERTHVRTANHTASIKPVKRFGKTYENLIVRGLNSAEDEIDTE